MTFFVCSYVLLFLLQFLVCVHRSAEQVHAMKKKNALIRIVYIWLHPVICYALLFATNALVQLVYKVSVTDGYSSVDSAKRLRRIMSVGLCVVVLLMVLMRIMHKGVVDHLRTSGRKMHVMYKICVAGMHLSLYWIVHDNLRFLLAQSFLTTSTNMVEMLIPMYSKSRAVNILFHRTTVDAENVPGAQKELNANRKSIVGKLSEHRTHGHEHGHGNGRSVNGSSSHALLELQTTSSPQQRQHKHQHHASSPSVSPVPAPSSPADIHNALHPTNLNTHGASDSDGNGERDERNGAEASSAAAVATPITEV